MKNFNVSLCTLMGFIGSRSRYLSVIIIFLDLPWNFLTIVLESTYL